MGDQAELFTDEEKVILGEKEPDPAGGPEETPALEGELKPAEGDKTEPKEAEVKETEPTPEEKDAMESMGLRIDKGYIIDDDGTKIPAKRWKSMYRDFQEEKRTRTDTDRKFQLFKELGAEKYYEVYPDEKPEDFKSAAKPKETEGQMPALGSMVIQGGPHDGKTLNEVWQEDPAFASYLQNQYLQAENKKVEDERQTQERVRKESEDEVNTFSETLSREMFGKESSKLSPQEESKVSAAIQSTLNWMAKTKRGGGVIADAHFLMNQEKILADAKAKGGKEALESLRKPGIPSVNTGGGAAVAPFAAYEEMSPDQLREQVEKMSDAGYAKFLKEAPQPLRAKHPGLPWS